MRQVGLRIRRQGGLRWSGVMLGAGLLCGCGGSNQDRTSILFRVDTDLKPGAEVDEIAVDVSTRTGDRTFPFRIDSAGALPVLLGLVPGADRQAKLSVAATARLHQQALIERTALIRFIPDHAFEIDLFLSAALGDASVVP